jgi:hypothetical protein
MKRIPVPKPTEISILIPHKHEGSSLVDYRLTRRYGDMKFGSIKQVADNLGVKIKKTENGLICTATKARLQMFAEKLHFSLIQFH